MLEKTVYNEITRKSIGRLFFNLEKIASPKQATLGFWFGRDATVHIGVCFNLAIFRLSFWFLR